MRPKPTPLKSDSVSISPTGEQYEIVAAAIGR